MPNAIFFYRISRWFFERKIPLIPKLFQLLIFVIYNCRIPGSASIGRGSFFVVKGIGVSIHDKTVIGQNCVIGIGVKVVGKSPFTVVTKSIPKGSIVGGIPAKIIGHIDDLDYDIFHNLSTDQSIAEFMQRK